MPFKMGNFYFRPKHKTAISLPISNLFQWFPFYIRDFIWIITLTENRNLKKIVDLKVYCNLKQIGGVESKNMVVSSALPRITEVLSDVGEILAVYNSK